MTRKISVAVFWISLALSAINVITVSAQTMEITVTGGGYRISGPGTIAFPTQPFSFEDQVSTINFADLIGNNFPYLEITDENGGSTFNVSIVAENLLPGDTQSCNSNSCPCPPESPDTYSCIPNINLAVSNYDGVATNPIDTMDGNANAVLLDDDTDPDPDPPHNPIATLEQQRILLDGNGSAPGRWRIHPKLQATIPGGTSIDTYSGSITITILTI